MLIRKNVSQETITKLLSDIAMQPAAGLADLARSIANTPYEAWAGGCTVGFGEVEGRPAVFYRTISGRVLAWDGETFCAWDMDESVNFRGLIEDFLGPLEQEEIDWPWRAEWLARQPTGESSFLPQQLAVAFYDAEEVAAHNEFVLQAIASMEAK